MDFGDYMAQERQADAAFAREFSVLNRLSDAGVQETWEALQHNEDDRGDYNGVSYGVWKTLVWQEIQNRGLEFGPSC